MWITITPETLTNYLTKQQLDFMCKDQAPCRAIIASVIERVRLEIATNRKNKLSVNPSLIPLALKSSACHLCIEALQSRFPTLRLSPDQVRNANNARNFLKRIAEGKVNISLTDEPFESPYIQFVARAKPLKKEALSGI